MTEAKGGFPEEEAGILIWVQPFTLGWIRPRPASGNTMKLNCQGTIGDRQREVAWLVPIGQEAAQIKEIK